MADIIFLTIIILLFLSLLYALYMWVKTKKNLESTQQENIYLKAELSFEKQRLLEKEKAFEEIQTSFTQTFQSLAQKALISNNESFLNLAKSTFQQFSEKTKIEMDQKHDSISKLVDPLQKSLEQVDQKMQNLEKERISAFADLKRQVVDLLSSQKELRQETANLVKALRNPTGRGQWGEMQLRRVVEMAGMISHCDFVEQVQTADGKLRPDMVVRLPGGKFIIVDAKTPLHAYLEAFEATDDDKRKQFMADHARQVRTHIRALSQRQYWEQFPSSPEFVVMFLPGEAFFSSALEYDPSLIEYGVQEKVILATPTTLIALLRAVAYGWQQEALAENARHIWQLGRELFKRISDFSQHFNKVGRHLSQAVSAYNDGVGTFEKRVLVTARKLKDLDPGLKEQDIDLSSLDIQTRKLLQDEVKYDEEK